MPTINGTYTGGVTLSGSPATITNTTTISGTASNAVGIYGPAGTPWDLTNHGLISETGANSYGISFAASGTITNATFGTIAGATSGIMLHAGGSVTNQAGGTITGLIGIAAFGGATVVNAGSIGGTTAVVFGSGVASRVVVDPGAVFSGTVNGGNTIGSASISTLELASGASAGTLSGLGTQFIDFVAVTVDANANWTLVGANTLIAGTTLTSSGALSDSGTLTNAGTMAVGPGLIVSGTFANTGLITGAPSTAVYVASGGVVSNSGTGLIAGAVGSYGLGVNGGGGGNAVSLSSGSVTNGAAISGGAGGASDIQAGVGGIGVSVSGGSLTNSTLATITGGVGGYGISVYRVSYGSGGTGGIGVAVSGGSLTNQGTIAGGGGGGGAYGGAGVGGYGVVLSNGSLTNQGSITGGGGGGSDYASGAGGYGVVVTNSSLTNQGTISGGGGGNSDDGGSTGGGGATVSGGLLFNATSGLIIAGAGGQNENDSGGTGGIGIGVSAGGSIANQGTIIGGIGGGGGGYSANGGDGVDVSGASITNQGIIIGGAGVTSGWGGNGANGVVLNGGIVANQGTINGGAGGALGDGGDGVSVLSGTLINAGTIAGGIGRNIFNRAIIRADAVQFSGAGRLVVDPGASFAGAVAGDAAVTDVLELASAASAGVLAGLGTSITNFSSLVFDPGAAWTVAGNDLASGLGTLGISGFTVGDTIDLTGFAAVSETFASNALVLTNTLGAQATLAMQGSFVSGDFVLASDNNGGTDITAQSAYPQSFTGTAADQAVNDNATVQPFSGVVINDPNVGTQSETVTITLTDDGPPTDANGTLSGAGIVETSAGIYQLTAASASAATAALEAVVFTPTAHEAAPGDTINTGMTLAVTDTLGEDATDATTSVVTTAVNDPPTFTGTLTDQTVDDNATVQPFSTLTVVDPDVGAIETVTIVLSDGLVPTDANGTLSGNGLSKTGTGTYTLVAGTPTAVSAMLDALVFTPTAHETAPGDSITTGMTLSVTDGLSTPTVEAGNVVTATIQTLAIDNTTPIVTTVTASPSDAILGAGALVALTLGLNEAVTVDTTNGTPTLTLNNGGTATYVSGSGTDALVFDYTVAPGQTIADLAVTGVSLSGSTVTDTNGNAADLTGATADLSGTLSIEPSAIMAFNTSTDQPIGVVAQVYSGPVAGLQNKYVIITSANLNITATTPNWFLSSGGGGEDALTASSGTNVLDGGSDSSFLTGGTGSDTFFLDARGATADIWSTVANFHAGDAVTIWGVTPADFTFDFENNQGATGYTGLTLHATAPGSPIVSVTFAGFTAADLTDGRISESSGTVDGSTYTYFHANA